jgi:hypothetical protein
MDAPLLSEEKAAGRNMAEKRRRRYGRKSIERLLVMLLLPQLLPWPLPEK